MKVAHGVCALCLLFHLVLVMATRGCDRRPPDQGACSQLCRDASSGPSCACVPGYSLHSDGARCVADTWAIPGTLLIYNEANWLNVFNLSTLPEEDTQWRRHGQSTVLYRANNLINAIDVDMVRRRVYFAFQRDRTSELRSLSLGTAEGIFDSAIDKHVDDEILNGLMEVHSIAMDWVGDNVYIADVGLQSVLACSLLSYSCVTVLNGLTWLGPIAVDSNSGQLYWNDCSGVGSLVMSKLDGERRRTLLSGVGCVNSLTIDLPLQTIYWVRTYGPGAGYCHINNCTKASSFEISAVYQALTVFEDDLVLATDSPASDYGDTSVDLVTANKFSPTSYDVMLIKRHLTSDPSILRVMHGGLQVRERDVCTSLNCSHICLLSSATAAHCACPAGMELHSDHHRCLADWQVESVLIASGSDVLRMSTDHVGGLVDDVIFSTQSGADVIAMTYETVEEVLYVAVISEQLGADYIGRSNLQQQPLDREILYDGLVNVTDMDVDDANIYWIADGKLMVGRRDGAISKMLVDSENDERRLKSLTLDTRNKKLVYSDCGLKVSIVRSCSLSGDDCRILMNRTRCVHDMYFDADVSTLYWIEDNIVMFVDGGGSRPEFLKHSVGPRAVVTTSEHVVWSDDHEAVVYMMGKRQPSELRAIKTGREQLASLTVARPSSFAQHSLSGCSENNGGCSGLCIAGEPTPQCLCADITHSTCTRHILHGRRSSTVPAGDDEVAQGGVTWRVTDARDEMHCRRRHCLNGGTCVVDAQQLETCQCPTKFTGKKCELELPAASSVSPSSAASTESYQLHMYIAAVIGVVVLTCAIVTAVCCARMRRRRGSSIVSGDELNLKPDHTYQNYDWKPSETSESSVASKPLALPRPSLVQDRSGAKKSSNNPV